MTMDNDSPAYDHNQRITDPLSQGSSTTLKSTSKYLNHPQLRHWVYTECLRKNGPDYEHFAGVLELGDILDDLIVADEVNPLFSKQRAKDPALDQWFSEGYLSNYQLSDLEDFANGTLGKEYYKMMTARDLSPDFLPQFEPQHDYDYWKRRAIQTHDIEHLVTEFRTDPMGEFGIIAAKATNVTIHLGHELAKHLNVYSAFLVTSAQLRLSLHCPELVPVYFRTLGRAEKLGSNAEPIYTPKYEEMWDVSVEEVRQELNVLIPEDMEDTGWTSEVYHRPQ